MPAGLTVASCRVLPPELHGICKFADLRQRQCSQGFAMTWAKSRAFGHFYALKVFTLGRTSGFQWRRGGSGKTRFAAVRANFV
jgi:hypothetical protein